MTCPSCGKPLDAGATSCRSCGATIGDGAAVSASGPFDQGTEPSPLPPDVLLDGPVRDAQRTLPVPPRPRGQAAPIPPPPAVAPPAAAAPPPPNHTPVAPTAVSPAGAPPASPAPVPGLQAIGSGTSQRNLKPIAGEEQRSAVVLRVNDVLSSRYRLDQKVGEGGMGTVYIAHDLELDRQVAIKLLSASLVNDAEVVERFEREARLTAKLDHPHIVPIYDVGRQDNRPYIVMKLLQGDTLAGVLREKGGFNSDETLKLMKQLAAGLDYIHARGFIHRDIKAGNIFVAPDGHATILDFGILRPRSAAQGLTRQGMVMGTPHYMAPEQALGLKDVDHRVDLYSLGVVLFEVLTGTLPFEADSELRLIQMQAHSPPPEILDRAPWIPKPVAAVVRRALAKRPDDRFFTGADLVKALEGSYRESKGHPASPRGPHASPGIPSPMTSPSWRKLNDPAPDSAVAATDRKDGLQAPPPPMPPVPPPGQPSSGDVPVVQGALVSGERAASPNTSELHRGLRPSRLPYVAVAAVVLLIAGVAVWEPWQGTTEVVEPKVPDAAVAEVVVDAGPAVVVEAPVDAGPELVVLADLDAGSEDEELDAGSSTKKFPLVIKKKNGKINVVTTHGGEPYWAQVSIDGVPRGRTPLLLDLPIGRYQLRVERAGFKAQEREIRVASGKSTVVRIDLIP